MKTYTFNVCFRARGRGRRSRAQDNQPAMDQNQPDRLELILQAIQQQGQALQQQSTLLLQLIQGGRVPQAAQPNAAPAPAYIPPPAVAPEQQESVAEVRGPPPAEQGLPPPPPIVTPQRNMLSEFIKCNRYFEGQSGKPEEAEDWLAQIERSFGVFQVPETLKVPYRTYLLRLRSRLLWDSKQRTLLQPITWETFR